MKRYFGYALMLALLAVPAFAAKNSKTVNFPEAVTVGSTQLPAGDYKVTWTGTGSDVQVTIEQQYTGHPATSTVAAKVVEGSGGPTGFTANSVNGVSKVQSLRLGKVDLVLAGAAAQGQ